MNSKEGPVTNNTSNITKKQETNNSSNKKSSKNSMKNTPIDEQCNEILEIINSKNLVGDLYKKTYANLNERLKKSKTKTIKINNKDVMIEDGDGNLDIMIFSLMMVGKLDTYKEFEDL